MHKNFTKDQISQTKNDAGQTVFHAEKKIDDPEAIAAAKKELTDAGYGNITETKNADGTTTVKGDKLIDNAEAIKAAKDELLKSFTEDQISQTKNDAGQTVFHAEKKVDDPEAIEAAKKELTDAGYGNITETKNADGNNMCNQQRRKRRHRHHQSVGHRCNHG